MIVSRNKKITLSHVLPGQAAILGKPERSVKILRLLELGLLEGTRIKVFRQAMFGGPIEVGLRGTRICLRRQEAECFPISEHPCE